MATSSTTQISFRLPSVIKGSTRIQHENCFEYFAPVVHVSTLRVFFALNTASSSTKQVGPLRIPEIPKETTRRDSEMPRSHIQSKHECNRENDMFIQSFIRLPDKGIALSGQRRQTMAAHLTQYGSAQQQQEIGAQHPSPEALQQEWAFCMVEAVCQ